MNKLLIFAFSMLPFAALCSAEGVLSGEKTALTDTVPPTVVCWNGLAANIGITGQVTLRASDFVLSVSDNSTPSDSIVLAIRKCDLGSFFPIDPSTGTPVQSLTFNCSELGTQCVEIWAMDSTGVQSFVRTYVIVQDNAGICKPAHSKNIETDLPPTIVVKNGLSASFLETGQLSISVQEFVQRAEDDVTPTDELTFGIRFCGTGDGFPTGPDGEPISTLTFSCFESGTRCVDIWAKDGDGNAAATCSYVLALDNMGFCPGSPVSDLSPVAICRNGIAVNISPLGSVSVRAEDLIQRVYDDTTPSDSIQISIRESGTGGGFPLAFGQPVTALTFDQNQLGLKMLEVWARDQTGRANNCETYVDIQINDDQVFLTSLVPCVNYWCNNAPINQLDFQIQGNAAWVGQYSQQISSSSHCAPVPGSVRLFGNATVTPKPGSSAPPPATGVTVFDLALVKRLILGYDDGLSPFAILAADANRSGTVTSADILEMRQVILGLKANFPDEVSWRYVEDGYQFPDPQNPFLEPLPESHSFYVESVHMNYARFKAVKVGDLDCDGVFFGEEGGSSDRGLPAHALTLPDLMLGQGQQAEIAFQLNSPGQWSAMQWELRYDPEQLDITDFLTEMPNLQQHEADMGFAAAPGSLRFLWAGAESLPLPAGEALFSIRLRALQTVQTSEALSLGDGIERLGIRDGEQAAISLEFRSVGQPQGAGAIYPPQPNPTGGSARIPMWLEQPGTAQVELSDAAGRRVWAQRQDLDSGMQWLQIPAEAMPQPGVYFWRAAVGGLSAQGKLLRSGGAK
jgi:hypothetical protein